jgi:hypothetical protein
MTAAEAALVAPMLPIGEVDDGGVLCTSSRTLGKRCTRMQPPTIEATMITIAEYLVMRYVNSPLLTRVHSVFKIFFAVSTISSNLAVTLSNFNFEGWAS